MYPNLKQSVLLVIFFFSSFALFFFLTGTIPQLFGLQLSEIYLTVIFSIASPVAILPLIIYVSKKSGIQLKWLIKIPGIHIILLLALLAVSVKIITSPFNNPKEFFNYLFNGRLKQVVFDIPEFNLNIAIRFIGTVLIVPIFEEIFCRKQILGLLLKKYSPVVSIVLSSAFFAVGHLRFNDIGTLFIWGILYGIVYYQTNSIEASILLHSFCNFSGFFVKKQITDITELQLFKCVSIMVVSAIVIILIIKYLDRFRTMKIQNQENAPDTL